MTQNERGEVARAFTAVARFFIDKELKREDVSAWIDAVQDIPAAKVTQALRAWFNDPKATRPPTPGQIRALCFPKLDDRTVAIDAASRIIAAAPKFGHQGSRQIADARAYIGELGWLAVERMGGWQFICENLGTKALPIGMAQAQLRDLCEAQIRLSKSGQALPPGIPKPELSEGEAQKVLNAVSLKPKSPDEEGK